MHHTSRTPLNVARDAFDEDTHEVIVHAARVRIAAAERDVIDAGVEAADTPSGRNLAALKVAVANLDRANDEFAESNRAAQASFDDLRRAQREAR